MSHNVYSNTWARLTPRLDRNLSVHPSADDLYSNRIFSSWASTVWATNRTGPYSIATGNVAAWLSFPVISDRWELIASELESQNHSEYLPLGTHPTVAAGYRAQMLSYASALRGNLTAFYNHVLSGSSTSGIVVDLHPLSRGTVTIDLTDPYNRPPKVDYRALSNPLDAKIMADILRFTRRYYLNNTLTAAYIPQESRPGLRVNTDEELISFIKDTMSPSEFHPAGTCAMLPRELGGVVDEELRVYGVTGLRVVDASIMPTLPGANTCQAVYAIAEKVRAPLGRQ